jgi:hypothetical protein
MRFDLAGFSSLSPSPLSATASSAFSVASTDRFRLSEERLSVDLASSSFSAAPSDAGACGETRTSDSLST